MTDDTHEEGVSEVIGAVLLVGLTVLGVAIVAAVLISDQQSTEIPHAAIAVGNNESGYFALVHEGGDPLNEGEYRIYLDTGCGLVDGTGDFTGPADGVWSIGEAINYTGSAKPDRVVVTAVTGSGETILAEPAFDGGGTAAFAPDPVEPRTGMTPAPQTTTSPVMIVGPDSENDYVIDTSKNFDFSVNVSTPAAEYVHMVIYNYKELNKDNNGELKSHIIAMNLTQNEANDFFYNHTLKTTTNLGSDGDRISVTAIVYDKHDRVIASESVLGTLDIK